MHNFLLVLQEYTFGPGHQSGTINTFAVMKSGIKNVDSTGRRGPIPSQKAQKRLVCSSYFYLLLIFFLHDCLLPECITT